MKTAILCVTEGGKKTAQAIKSKICCDIYTKNDYTSGIINFTSRIYSNYSALIFICATGIAVRAIAPLIKSKCVDPAILVIDDKRRFVISLLAGHIGGANKLCIKVAEILNAMPVITTATDINDVLSFDVFALDNNLYIENIQNLKYISGAILSGERVGFIADECIIKNVPDYIALNSRLKNNVIMSHKKNIDSFENENNFILRPKNVVIGIGCKKNTKYNDINTAVKHFLNKNNISMQSVKCIATIGLKKDEYALNKFCIVNKLYAVIIPNEEIIKRENEFKCSEFVKKTTGVGNVSEACAVCAFENTRLICKKTVYNGITLALGLIIKEYNFD